MSNELREHLINHRKATGDFERENRYIVLKRKHLGSLPKQLQHRLKPAVEDALALLPKLNCLVIESDWPEYEPTWAAIEARMTRAAHQPPALGGEPELDCLADVPYANETPADWDPDYRKIWQELQVETRNKSQLRAHLAPLQAEIASERKLRRELGVRVHQLKDELKDVAHIKARNAELERLLLDAGREDWSIFVQRAEQLLLSKPAESECCTPTDEERALLAAGDCTPEELWGGPRPTCPKCIKPAGSKQV